jgi:hypothetical protein
LIVLKIFLTREVRMNGQGTKVDVADILLSKLVYAKDIEAEGWVRIIFQLIELSKHVLKKYLRGGKLREIIFKNSSREKFSRDIEPKVLENFLVGKDYRYLDDERMKSPHWSVLGRAPYKNKAKEQVGEICIALNEEGLLAIFYLTITTTKSLGVEPQIRQEQVVGCRVIDNSQEGFRDCFEELLREHPDLGSNMVYYGFDQIWLGIAEEERMWEKILLFRQIRDGLRFGS